MARQIGRSYAPRTAHWSDQSAMISSLKVRLHPGARKNAITGMHDGAVKIALTAPPVDGKANDALITFLADLLHAPKSSISILSGHTSRQKTLAIKDKSAAQIEAALSSFLSPEL